MSNAKVGFPQPPFERSFTRTEMPMTAAVKPFPSSPGLKADRAESQRSGKTQSGLRRPPSACMSIPPDPPQASRREPGDAGIRGHGESRLAASTNSRIFASSGRLPESFAGLHTARTRRRHLHRGLWVEPTGTCRNLSEPGAAEGERHAHGRYARLKPWPDSPTRQLLLVCRACAYD